MKSWIIRRYLGEHKRKCGHRLTLIFAVPTTKGRPIFNYANCEVAKRVCGNIRNALAALLLILMPAPASVVSGILNTIFGGGEFERCVLITEPASFASKAAYSQSSGSRRLEYGVF